MPERSRNPQTQRKRVQNLYREGLSKNRIHILEGISYYQVNKSLSRVKQSSIAKHERNKEKVRQLVYELNREQKLRTEYIEIRAEHGKEDKKTQVVRQRYETTEKKIKKLKRRIPKKVVSHAQESVEEEPTGYLIVLNAIVEKKGGKYTVLDDLNIYTNEKTDLSDVLYHLDQSEYRFARTNRMKKRGVNRVDVGIIRGKENISENTIITDDWKTALDNSVTGQNFRNRHSGAYWRRMEKMRGGKVSNPEYEEAYEDREEI